MKNFFDKCVQKASALIQKACEHKSISHVPQIILGLSGGPDSVFLLHVLCALQKQNKIQLIATHLDHQWRQESHKDVDFCKQLCADLSIEFVPYKAGELDSEFKFNGSKEELGRKMRRFVFQKVLKEKQADFIALAHHLQDQQETFFIRLMRGASLSGLCCMSDYDGLYLRPLLSINKKEILEYLDSNCHPGPCPELDSGSDSGSQIEYLIDYTNTSPNYLRNRIRSNVIPALETVDNRFGDKFQSTLEMLVQENNFLNALAEQAFNDIFVFDSNLNAWTGNLHKFKLLHVVLARRVVLHWLIKEKLSFNLSSNYIDEIIKFLNSTRGGQHQVGAAWSIFKKQKSFWVSVQ